MINRVHFILTQFHSSWNIIHSKSSFIIIYEIVRSNAVIIFEAVIKIVRQGVNYNMKVKNIFSSKL